MPDRSIDYKPCERRSRELASDNIRNVAHQWQAENHAMSEILKSLFSTFNRKTINLLLPSIKHNTKDGCRVEPYAMVKTLHENKNMIENDNLEFEISLMLD